jgi:uncharacterized protein
MSDLMADWRPTETQIAKEVAAYLGLIVLMVKRQWFPGLQRGLAAMGRMALTNYLGQTFICTTLFYGHGLGWFGRVERWQQLALALLILVLQMAISFVWLQRWRFGPLEWLWRSLTYRRWQPMRRTALRAT